MSSLVRYSNKIAKLPAGSKSIAQPDQKFLMCLNYAPYAFQQSDIDTLLSSDFEKVSASLYIAKDTASLNTVLNTLDTMVLPQFASRERNAIDLGKTIRIGLAGGHNDIITMRLVKRIGNVSSGGLPDAYPNICYVVTGNRMGQTYNTGLYTSILGTTPNNRHRKQYLNTAGYNPTIVASSQLESLLLSNSTKVSDSLYVASDMTNVEAILTALESISGSNTFVNDEYAAVDLGKTLYLSVAGGEGELLVFRLVERIGNIASGGGPSIAPNKGYVIVVNKVSKTPYNNAAQVSISGSAPNALEVKPQFLTNGGYVPYLFTTTDLQTAFTGCVRVSDSLYLATDISQLTSICNNLDNSVGRPYVPSNMFTTVEFGNYIRLGLMGGENDLLTFVLNKNTGSLATGGDSDPVTGAGYVVIGNKLSLDYHTALAISILGTAPRDC
jgi:hypothetical protein